MKKVLIITSIFIMSSCEKMEWNSNNSNVDSISIITSSSINNSNSNYLESIVTIPTSNLGTSNSVNTNIPTSSIGSSNFGSVTTVSSSNHSNSSSAGSISSNSSISIPMSNPYTTMTSVQFYDEYQSAQSYKEAIYRSEYGFMSGDITPQGHLPSINPSAPNYYGQYYRATNANYTYDTYGNYESFTINTLNGKARKTIYYGGAYTSLEEVAAYLLAFGEVPPNSNYDKSTGKNASVNEWGKYGRANIDYFSNDTYSYPYEPELAEVYRYNYTETDFGTIGGYTNGSYYQINYNDGYSINRGAARLVFTSTYSTGSKITNINDRHVFYTYNHYNDFQEYLNYEGGWGERFGFETAGNPYCANRTEYYGMYSPMPPTAYPATLSFTI